jgi:hypothetical protein
MTREKKDKITWVPLPPDICIICRKPQKERGGWYCSLWHDIPYVFPWDLEKSDDDES